MTSVTTPATSGPLRVGLRFDATPQIGVGHGMRMLALAEELGQRAVEVSALGRVDVPWLREMYEAIGCRIVDAPPGAAELTSLAGDLGLDAVALDGYDLDPASGRRLGESGIRVLAMSDERFGAAQDADIHLDQNYGATSTYMGAGVHLVGPAYWLARDGVRNRRRTTPVASGEPPRLLAVFGGTDPCRAADALGPLVLASGLPVELIVVTPHRQTSDAMRALPLAPGQRLEILSATKDLPQLAASCDAAISAAGSTVWELLCLGVPTAVVAVIDNQELGYAATVADGLTLPGGRLPHLDEPAERQTASRSIEQLLSDARLRDSLAARGRQIFDGDGRVRVADALLEGLPRSLSAPSSHHRQ